MNLIREQSATLLAVAHVAALVAWMGAWLASHVVLFREGRCDGPSVRLDLRRRAQRLFLAEHVALAALLATGLALMALRGWGLGRARWLGLKVGLAVFLVVPLEAMHAYVCHVWIARGLRQTPAPPLAKGLVRGAGMEEMIRTLAIPLLGLSVPLLVWLSVAKPF